MRNLLLLTLTLLASTAGAQEQPLEHYRNAYPNSLSVYLNYRDVYTIEVESADSLAITLEHEEERLYHNELSKGMTGKDEVHASGFDEVTDIKAYTTRPYETKKKKYKTREFFKKNELDGSIFHDDNTKTSFNYPNVGVGCVTHLEYTKVIHDPHMIGSFYFNYFTPSLNNEVTVKCDKSVNIGYTMFNADTFDIVYSKTEDKKHVYHHWKLKDSPYLKYEPDAPNPRYYLPHMVFYIEQYSVDGKTTPVYEGSSGLHQWYHSLLNQMEPSDDSLLQPLVDSLIAGKTTEMDKVTSIYQWVQENVKYIAFEDGLHGFVPDAASKVCSNRYGDCKGKASLVIGMLRLADIPAYYTWIGSRDIPYRYTELATVFTDNHMIATWFDNDSTAHFLDATGNTSIAYPNSFIQGKEALIGVSPDRHLIREVPVKSAEDSYISDTSWVNINGRTLEGKSVIAVQGYLKFRVQRLLENKTQQEQQKYLEGYLSKGNNKFHLLNFTIQWPAGRELPLRIDYDFEIMDYVTNLGSETYVNLNLSKYFDNEKIKDDRVLPIERDFKLKYNNVLYFKSDEFSIANHPANSSFEHPDCSFDFNYRKDDGSLTLRQNYTSNFLMLQKDEFEAYNNMIKALKKAHNESVELKMVK